MQELETIKEYRFDGYEPSKVQSTIETIADLTKDAEKVWNEWINSGMDVTKPFSVDFEFYSAHKEGAEDLAILLTENDYEVSLRSKRMLLIFKGWEVVVSLNTHWTLAKLQDMIEKIGLLGRKYNASIEGYGALIKA